MRQILGLPDDIKPNDLSRRLLSQVARELAESPTLIVSEDGLNVRRRHPLGDITEMAEAIDRRSLFMEPFPFDCNHGDAISFFARAVGSVKSVRMLRHQEEPKTFSGCAFVEFATEQLARQVLERKEPLVFEGAELHTEMKLDYLARTANGNHAASNKERRLSRESQREAGTSRPPHRGGFEDAIRERGAPISRNPVRGRGQYRDAPLPARSRGPLPSNSSGRGMAGRDRGELYQQRSREDRQQPPREEHKNFRKPPSREEEEELRQPSRRLERIDPRQQPIMEEPSHLQKLSPRENPEDFRQQPPREEQRTLQKQPPRAEQEDLRQQPPRDEPNTLPKESPRKEQEALCQQPPAGEHRELHKQPSKETEEVFRQQPPRQDPKILPKDPPIAAREAFRQQPPREEPRNFQELPPQEAQEITRQQPPLERNEGVHIPNPREDYRGFSKLPSREEWGDARQPPLREEQAPGSRPQSYPDRGPQQQYTAYREPSTWAEPQPRNEQLLELRSSYQPEHRSAYHPESRDGPQLGFSARYRQQHTDELQPEYRDEYQPAYRDRYLPEARARYYLEPRDGYFLEPRARYYSESRELCYPEPREGRYLEPRDEYYPEERRIRYSQQPREMPYQAPRDVYQRADYPERRGRPEYYRISAGPELFASPLQRGPSGRLPTDSRQTAARRLDYAGRQEDDRKRPYVSGAAFEDGPDTKILRMDHDIHARARSPPSYRPVVPARQMNGSLDSRGQGSIIYFKLPQEASSWSWLTVELLQAAFSKLVTSGCEVDFEESSLSGVVRLSDPLDKSGLANKQTEDGSICMHTSKGPIRAYFNL